MEHINIDLAEAIKIIDQRDKENNLTVRIPIDEYMALKTSFDEYQSKKYKIELSINHRHIIEENGETTNISHLHTNTMNFPDDTQTQLSELFASVYENSHYVEHLEQKVRQLKAMLAVRDVVIERQKSDISFLSTKSKWWKR